MVEAEWDEEVGAYPSRTVGRNCQLLLHWKGFGKGGIELEGVWYKWQQRVDRESTYFPTPNPS